MFEVGKTYKNKFETDVKIIHQFVDGRLLGLCEKNDCHYVYYKDGREVSGYGSHDLVPLKKVIGGIYRDNHGELRVLMQVDYELRAKPLQQKSGSLYSFLSTDNWTKNPKGKFELVELVNDPGELI